MTHIRRTPESDRSGKLPTRKPDRTYGGPRSGTSCAVCGEPVTSGQVELEIGFRRDGARPRLGTYQLHPRCFAVWEIEREKIEETGESVRTFS